jgi:hypothetical protein
MKALLTVVLSPEVQCDPAGLLFWMKTSVSYATLLLFPGFIIMKVVANVRLVVKEPVGSKKYFTTSKMAGER